MSQVTHILDTSALLAHFFDETGADVVDGLWSTGTAKVGVSAVTVAELKGRLHQEVSVDAEAENAAALYLSELTICLPVDRVVAELAWQLREHSSRRLPLVDALIAATARSVDAVLVHKDPHMAQISADVVRQIVLPADT